MSIINTQIKPFKATAYHAGKFVDLTEADFKGTWSVLMFYPADFTFVCPTELEDLAAFQPEFDKMGVKSTACRPTATSPTRHGTTLRKPSRK
jgi:peroxiredoxin (alkyl hydroperoxide reductase subunit C)